MKKKFNIGTVLLLEMVVLLVVFVINLIFCQGAEWLISMANFIDLASLLLIVLIVVPALWLSGMGQDFLRSFSIGKREYSLRELKRSLEAVQMVQRMLIYGALITSIVAVVIILKVIGDFALIGPNLAVAVLVIFYAAILEFLLILLKANTQNAITDLMEVEDEEA